MARSVARLRARALPLSTTLFWAALGVYALTRLTALDAFPAYFFSDEAIQTLNAADFVRLGLRDHLGRRFPTYFQNGSYFNLGVSVYAQVLPYLLLGKSIAVTRGTAALLAGLAAVAVSLTLRDAFRARWWWLAAMLLAVAPAWLLHSRTAFETALMVAFYAWFLYLYLLYRLRDPRWLYPALVAGALAFYSYRGGQFVVVLTGLLLLASDARYHWAQRRTGAAALVLLAALAAPALRHALEQPGESLNHLKTLDSYWVRPELGLRDRLAILWREYALGLSPGYWFGRSNNRDLARHVMPGYGHLLPATAPLVGLGLAVCLARPRRPASRVVLAALLAAPAGGALAEIGITRVLVMVVPAALLAALGAEWLLALVARRWPARWRAAGGRLAPAAQFTTFALLAGVAAALLGDALAHGATWTADYGLGGLQWGASQVAAEVRAYLAGHPAAQVTISPTWTNGADYVIRFLLDDEPRVRTGSIAGFADRPGDLTAGQVFVMTPDEYAGVLANPKFAGVQVERVLAYPDGRPGFRFVRLRYSDAAAGLFAEERAARQQPQSETLLLDGQLVRVRYSPVDIGRVQNIFDGDPFTLARTDEANPALVELTFAEPRPVSAVRVTVGSMDVRLTAEVAPGPEPGAALRTYTEDYTGLPDDPTVRLPLGEADPVPVQVLRLLIDNLTDPENTKLHIREIELEP